MSGGYDDDTRRQVERLYDEHPYPDHGVVGSTVAGMARRMLGDGASPQRILDAGCGTGEQTLGLAREFPGAEVVGIDIGERSLARARHHARKHRIDVRVERCDLLDGPFDHLGTFDLITSVGVLHHLPDPSRALANLAGLANPGGRLLGMVYGRYGKQEMFDQRDAIALLAGGDREVQLATAGAWRRSPLGSAATALREVDRRRRFGPDIPFGELVRRALAGRNRSFVADSYTHVQELAFTWADVADLLGMSGWRFDGWPPRSGMPDRPEDLLTEPALSRARALPLIEVASVYERSLRPSNLYFAARPATAP